MPLALFFVAKFFTWAQVLGRPSAKRPKVLSSWLTMLFLVLPVISRRVCQSFRCDEYDAGDRGVSLYLSSDLSLDCTTDRYFDMFIYACVMVLVSLIVQKHIQEPEQS